MEMSNKIYGCGFALMVFFVLGVPSRSRVFQDQSGNFHQEDSFSKNYLTSINSRDDDRSSRATDADCSEKDIYIFQSQTTKPLGGIPIYTVEIHNICLTETCSISNIHLSCGWYSSATLVNPNIFRRIAYNDCLVNNGNPITPGQTISFQYSNTFSYPMTLASYTCNYA